jgi:hypothetical protein
MKNYEIQRQTIAANYPVQTKLETFDRLRLLKGSKRFGFFAVIFLIL